MASEYKDAPAVEQLVKKLVERHHTHLGSAKIKCLFRDGRWSSSRRTTWAKTYKVGDRDRHLHGYDFVIVVNAEVWRTLDERAREALIDHELAHCGVTENGAWCIWPHDLEDFAAVVSRHGAWSEDVKRYLAAAERAKAGGSTGGAVG